ncbi:hypothetical protein HYPSUDRAFT_1095993 [Hypholoma sublateritium FD-334 SS-4]|uniref:Hydrophobin n=1 Tax=Hypholoma sublateritium (strain FD-334 SS-4) TaxID=945553 RepID=A0A0D2NKK8_HYPSF|nr:hypothetical protein HYPSUDRAFT_1095993 [Hypholoma sublateritium FD-334 SS-4]
MQFATLSALTTLALAAFSVADSASSSNQCDTGSLQCCNSVQAADTRAASALLTLLGVSVQDVTGLVGLTCSPVTAIGASGTSCSAQAACCTNNSFNGVVATGCTPINLGA